MLGEGCRGLGVHAASRLAGVNALEGQSWGLGRGELQRKPVLGDVYVTLNRMVVRAWVAKAVLTTSQIERTAVLLDSGEKAILVQSGPVFTPSCSGRVELESDDIRHVTEEISKQNAGGAAWVLLLADSKMGEER